MTCRENDIITQVETGVMQLQVKECQGTPPPEARKDKEGA